MGTLLHHTVRGARGPVRLLVHGFLGSGRNLSSLARSWLQHQPEQRLVLVDLPGHGDSPPLTDASTLDDMGRALVELANSLDAGSVDIVGHSLGGRAALAARRLDPETVDTVVLLDIPPGPTRGRGGGSLEGVLGCLMEAPERARERETIRDGLVECGLSRMIADWLVQNLQREGDGYGWRIDREQLVRLHARHADVDLWDAVERDPQRTVMIRAADSGFVTDADLARLRAFGCPVHTVKRAGHFLHVEQPEALTALLVHTFRSSQ